LTARKEAASLADAVEHLITVIMRRRRALGHEPSPLTATQGVALSTVARARRLRLGALGEALGTTDATASRTVDALQALGLVERDADPEDGRGVVVAITQKGRRFWEQRHRRFVMLMGALVSDLDPTDQERFVRLLTDLNELLRDDVSASS
jgi:DNA-binding MarR family transcriptional regulator